MKIIQTVSACIATLFGLLTIFAGSRVLLGSDPGYVVFQPLLIFNTAMGFVYVAAGITIWRNFTKGRNLAAVIFTLNLIVLAIIYFLYTQGSLIAVDSLGAMSLRTGVWLALFSVLGWLSRKKKHRPDSGKKAEQSP